MNIERVMRYKLGMLRMVMVGRRCLARRDCTGKVYERNDGVVYCGQFGKGENPLAVR